MTTKISALTQNQHQQKLYYNFIVNTLFLLLSLLINITLQSVIFRMMFISEKIVLILGYIKYSSE